MVLYKKLKIYLNVLSNSIINISDIIININLFLLKFSWNIFGTRYSNCSKPVDFTT